MTRGLADDQVDGGPGLLTGPLQIPMPMAKPSAIAITGTSCKPRMY